MKTLLLVDGHALAYRAYHALPDFKTKKGMPTSALYGFITMLLKTYEDFQPDNIIVCFDTPEATFRKKLFNKYQIQRPEMEEALKSQFPLVKDFLTKASIPYVEAPGYEADDLIGTLAKKAQKNFFILILTGDRDIVQLVNKKTQVIIPKKGLTEIYIYNEKRAEERFGVKPKQIPDVKALMGDPSDNYKGVPGVGPKTAAALIQKFGSLENLYKNIDRVESKKTKELLIKHKKQAFLGKTLATIVRSVKIDINIESCAFPGYNEKLKQFFKDMEFNSLIKRCFKKRPDKISGAKEDKKADKEQRGLF